MLERVEENNKFIVIAGPSGSGKSSVARAGLFHALREGRVEGSEKWVLATMYPKSNPIEQLALSMARLVGNPSGGDYIKEQSISNPLALHVEVDHRFLVPFARELDASWNSEYCGVPEG